MRVMLVISYDGSKFYGFQRQKNVRNVQGYLEETLSKLLNEEIIVKGSGRTDAKVHAINQVVHFDTKSNIKNLKKDLNTNLKDIRIKKVKKVNDNFHARFSVKNKIYLYKIDLIGNKDPNYYTFVKNIDIKKIKQASKIFIGTHNFKNFVAGERYDYQSTITKIKIWKWNNILYLKFYGYGFYRYMIRNIVGALIEVGKGKINEDVLLQMLNNPDTRKSLPTALPNGLYLYKINY